jgi:hypothetical protein
VPGSAERERVSLPALSAIRLDGVSRARFNQDRAHALARLAEVQRSANVHFTEAGSDHLAEKVAAEIEKALE